MQNLSYIMTGISVILVIVMLATYKKVRPMSPRSLWLSILITLGILAAFWLIVGTGLSSWVLAAIGAAGVAFGLIRAQSTRIWSEKGRVLGQDTRWFLVIWALCYVLNLAVLHFARSYSLNVGIGAMCLGTGVTLGSHGTFLAKIPRARSVMSHSCPTCGNEISGDKRFCTRCGKPVYEMAYAPPPPAGAPIRCDRCGNMNAVSQRFCTRCGQQLG
jgi:hypothetical protein